MFQKLSMPAMETPLFWETALKNAGTRDFVFRNLSHDALNNLRRSGNDLFEIMALSVHKMMSVFKRYNQITEEGTDIEKMATLQERQRDQDGCSIG